MIALSAADAISPAIERTKRFLFHPFEWGTYLKLCAVAVLTEGFSANFRSSTPGGSPTHAATAPQVPFIPTPGLIAAIVGGIIAVLIVGLVLFYLVTRLRFAFFHCLIHQTKEILPGWRLYQEQAGRFFMLNVVVGLIFLGIAGLVALPFVSRLIVFFRAAGRGHHIDFFQLFSLILPLIIVVSLLALLAFATDIVMRDFILPHYALENATAGDAWTSVRENLALEPGPFLFYAVLRILLPAIGFIALFIAMAIPGLIIFGILGIAFAGLHAMSANAAGIFAFLGTLFEALIGLIGVGLAVFLSIFFGGPLSVGVRNYALLFYGGRYQLLGDTMYPPPPPAVARPATT
jgi:MFS family permease